jgi:transposase
MMLLASLPTKFLTDVGHFGDHSRNQRRFAPTLPHFTGIVAPLQRNPHKVSVVLELLRGADLESTSRKYRVTAATLTEWRDRFLAGGEAILKSREADVEDEEKRRLKSAVANISVENELLREKIARLEDGRPLAFWKSKP